MAPPFHSHRGHNRRNSRRKASQLCDTSARSVRAFNCGGRNRLVRFKEAPNRAYRHANRLEQPLLAQSASGAEGHPRCEARPVSQSPPYAGYTILLSPAHFPAIRIPALRPGALTVVIRWLLTITLQESVGLERREYLLCRGRAGGRRMLTTFKPYKGPVQGPPRLLGQVRLVAAITQSPTLYHRIDADRRNSFSATRRSSLACISKGSSPLSSRNAVHHWRTQLNRSSAHAPVKAPFDCRTTLLSITALLR